MSLSPSDVDSVFVYGTLKRGQCREAMWPETPIAVADAWVHGVLYGRPDYPALLGGDAKVRGEWWRFESGQMTAVLAALDEIEGTNQNAPDDLYHRVLVDVFDLRGERVGSAFTYRYNRDVVTDGFGRVPTVDGFQCWPPA